MSNRQSRTDVIYFMKRIGLFSLPLILNSLLSILPMLVSIWILSRLGKDQLAAAGIAVPTFFTIFTVFLMGFYAVGIKISHDLGKNNKDEVGPWVINGLIISLILTIPAIAILLNTPTLLLIFGQNPHLVALTKTFFYFGAATIFLKLVKTVFHQYFVGTGHPRISMIISIGTLPIIICLSYGLILGSWGLPKLAMGGITCASLIIETLSVLIIITIIVFAKWSREYKVFSGGLGINCRKCVELFKLGWPISIQVGGELSAMTALAYMLGLFGASALAATQVVQQYVLIFVMISLGLSQGVSVLISHSYGANDVDKIKTITIAGCLLMGAVSIVFVCGFLIFPRSLVDIYLNIGSHVNNSLVHFAIYFMLIAALYISFDGFREILTSALRGLQDSKIPMRIGVVCLWFVGLPIAYILGVLLHGGAIILRLGFVSGVAVGMLLVLLRYKKILNTKLSLSSS